MKNNPKTMINSTIKILSFSSSELGRKISFSFPQSSVLVLGDYRGIPGVQESFNNAIVDKFKYCIYIFDEITTNDYAQYLLNSGYSLNEVSNRDISEGNTDSNQLSALLQNNERLVISVEQLPKRLRKQYWKVLSLSIRSFFLENSVPIIPSISTNFKS